MRLDDKVTVHCTDTEKDIPGIVLRIRGKFVDVAVGDLILHLSQAKPGIWVGSQAGMEFVVKAAHNR